MTLALRPAVAADARWIAELRAVVMRPDLERLGRFDEDRVRTRLLAAFDPAATRVIVVDGRDAGCIAVRPGDGCRWIEHFYLAPELHGQGIGSRVLADVLAQEPGPLRLDVLQGSPARRLYERHGFVQESGDLIDVILLRQARETSSACTVPSWSPTTSTAASDR